MNLKEFAEGKSYKAAASVIKKNYIGTAKKYKEKELDSIVEKLNESIDKRDKEAHQKLILEFRTKMIELDMQKDKTEYVCIYRNCNEKATHVKIDKDKGEHMVLCDKHYKMMLSVA